MTTATPIPDYAKSGDERRAGLCDAELAILREFRIPPLDWNVLTRIPAERVRYDHLAVDAIVREGFSQRLGILASALSRMVPEAADAYERRQVALRLARAIAGAGVRWV